MKNQRLQQQLRYLTLFHVQGQQLPLHVVHQLEEGETSHAPLVLLQVHLSQRAPRSLVVQRFTIVMVPIMKQLLRLTTCLWRLVMPLRSQSV